MGDGYLPKYCDRCGGPVFRDLVYYGFDRTGVESIDRILAAVARAGKAYHHTGPETWTEPCETCGKSCADAIQEAANDAARSLKSSPRKPAATPGDDR